MDNTHQDNKHWINPNKNDLLMLKKRAFRSGNKEEQKSVQKELRKNIQTGRTTTGGRCSTSCSRATSIESGKALKWFQGRGKQTLRLLRIRLGWMTWTYSSISFHLPFSTLPPFPLHSACRHPPLLQLAATLPFACRDPVPILRILLCVKISDATRDEISLWHWSASGGSIRAALLVNRTSVNG